MLKHVGIFAIPQVLLAGIALAVWRGWIKEKIAEGAARTPPPPART